MYGNSFISLKQAFDDFANGAMYQNYCYLPRLQDIAEEYGVVEHLYLPRSAKEALKILGNQNEDDLSLIRVNTAFFIGYKRSSWREDHYICVNNKLEWINEYPLSEGKFTEERFTEVYDGAVCIYKVKDTKTDLPDYASMQFKMQDFDVKELPNNLSALESAIGVLRVSRKRLARYYVKNENVNSLLNEVVYSIKKVRNPDEKLSGFGFINDEGTLLCKCVSKTGKRYTRALDEVEQHCHPILGKEKEFKGYVTMYYNDVPLYNKEHDNYDVRDIEVEYSVWYKIVEEN